MNARALSLLGGIVGLVIILFGATMLLGALNIGFTLMVVQQMLQIGAAVATIFVGALIVWLV